MKYFSLFILKPGKPICIFLIIQYSIAKPLKNMIYNLATIGGPVLLWNPAPPPFHSGQKQSVDSLNCKPVGSFYTRLLY